MKGLPTLIRLRRQELDEKRRSLNDLEQGENLLAHRIQSLDEEVKHEQEFAGGSEEVRFAYENFAAAAKVRREGLVDALTAQRVLVEEAREEVSEAFREFKKLDIAEQNNRRRAEEESERRDRIAADEIGLEIHRRANR
jgi:flagellar export protein FliJ